MLQRLRSESAIKGADIESNALETARILPFACGGHGLRGGADSQKRKRSRADNLIVQPNLPKIGTDELPHHQAFGCVLGANVGPFWVLRNTNGRYGLLLATYALGLEILDSRSNFYRDIQATAATAGTLTTVVYKMSVAQYQVAEKKTEPLM